MEEKVLQHLSGRDDEFAILIVGRIQREPDLVAVGARYHPECISRMYHSLPDEGINAELKPARWRTNNAHVF